MTIDTHLHSTDDERTLLAIARRLPPDRGRQLLAFARFLAFESSHATDPAEFEDKQVGDSEADAVWNSLFASEEGQAALNKLADEALSEIQAGNTSVIIVTDDGELSDQ